MKIAIFHELDLGGARRCVNEFAKRLKLKNFVDLYYIDSVEDRDIRRNFPESSFYTYFSKTWKIGIWARLYKDTLELIKLYLLHKKIAREIDKKKYDFVFIHPSKYTQAPFLLSFLKTKTLYYCQEPLRLVYDPFVASVSDIHWAKKPYEIVNRRVRQYIDLLNISHADYILANSRYACGLIYKAYGRKSYVCYLGVDAKLFRPLPGKKKFDILFIGNKNDRRSGYTLLQESIVHFNNSPSVLFFSRGKEHEYITDAELVKSYNSAKIVVLLSRDEPFGLIALEAMACGIPVIAVNEGGFKESVVDNKTGIVIKRDAKELYRALIKLLLNDKLRKQMGKFSRQYVFKHWTWEKSSNRLSQIISQII